MDEPTRPADELPLKRHNANHDKYLPQSIQADFDSLDHQWKYIVDMEQRLVTVYHEMDHTQKVAKLIKSRLRSITDEISNVATKLKEFERLEPTEAQRQKMIVEFKAIRNDIVEDCRTICHAVLKDRNFSRDLRDGIENTLRAIAVDERSLQLQPYDGKPRLVKGGYIRQFNAIHQASHTNVLNEICSLRGSFIDLEMSNSSLMFAGLSQKYLPDVPVETIKRWQKCLEQTNARLIEHIKPLDIISRRESLIGNAPNGKAAASAPKPSLERARQWVGGLGKLDDDLLPCKQVLEEMLLHLPGGLPNPEFPTGEKLTPEQEIARERSLLKYYVHESLEIITNQIEPVIKFKQRNNHVLADYFSKDMVRDDSLPPAQRRVM